ncbi:MAG: His-Xaa-Ser system radical SAM maturase HxsB [Candidatus Izemoplasmatales bacterium]|nr:His-Xaa-Ser system radical SAM maturase HxsB [Candidatus Izemoplasmatales bacterium]
MYNHTPTGYRKFKKIEQIQPANPDYFLLPFRFQEIADQKEVIVNEVGDFLIVPIGTSTRIVNREISVEDPLFPDLFSNFFIADKPIPDLIDVLATRYRTKKSFMDDFTALHMVVITLRCNHSCHYCQVSRVTETEKEFDISFEHLEAAIKHIFHSPSKSITIEFQGGEPLLAFDKVKYTVERAITLNEKHSKHLTFVICTNSTLFTDDILQFCKKHDITISTSLDGSEFIHNSNRPIKGENSYAEAITGINRARSILGSDKVSALMTTSLLSLKHPIEIIDSYIKNGFSNIFLRPISRYGFALKNIQNSPYEIDEFLEFYKKGINYILNLNQNGQFFAEDYTTIILKKILTPFPVGYVDLQSPAGMINSAVVYNYDGFVYASDESRMLAANNDFTFRLGHVSDNYNSLFYGERAKFFSQYWLNECLAGCSDCGFQSYCGADPGYHYITQGDFEGFRPTSDHCRKNKEVIRYLFELIDSNENEILPIFYSWIYNRPRF